MKRLGLLALLATGLGCGPAPNLLPVNDLERPTDVAFMCFGAFPAAGAGVDAGVSDAGTTGPLQVSGRPMQACHPQNLYDPGPTTTTRTFAFLPESASGGLTAVDADHWKLLDLNRYTGGYGQVPLGQLPEQISASDDGCRLISANRGSCDLTLVDPSVLVASVFQTENATDTFSAVDPRQATRTFRPVKGDGTLLTAPPYEAVFLPQDTTSLQSATGAAPLCGDLTQGSQVAPVGWPSQPSPWYALVTYPTCDLIAVVALPSGQIVSSAYTRATLDSTGNKNGVTLVGAGTSPVCPISDCAGQSVSPSVLTGADAAGPVDAVQAPLFAAGLDAAADSGPGPAIIDAGGPAGAGAGTGAGGAAGGAPVGGTGGNSGGSTGAGTGGAVAGAFFGNQYPNDPYFGPELEVPSDPSSPSLLSPSSIQILPDGTRAYISLANASYVVAVGLASKGLVLPGNAIYLNEGARGSSRIRLSVDRNRQTTTGISGIFVGAESTEADTDFDPCREYLYAIARDGTLRVIWVAGATAQTSCPTAGPETECETNADPLNLAADVSPTDACIAVDPAHRRPFSVGPGIHFPSLPVDVAAADIRRPTTDTTLTSEQSVNGAHAWVLADTGIVYLVNINPVLRKYFAPDPTTYIIPTTANYFEQQPFVNTLRDRNEVSYSLTLDPATGPPRVDILPDVPPIGPYIEPFWTQGIINVTATNQYFVETGVFFPQEPYEAPAALSPADQTDRRAVTAQTWTVSWEGTFMGNRNSGVPLPLPLDATDPLAQLDTDSTPIDSLFTDGGADYCASGVVGASGPVGGSGAVGGDLLTLTGCTDNSQCALGEECVIDDSLSSAAAGLSVTGICVDPNQATARVGSCAGFLETVRRYQVVVASPTALIIRPNLDEIVLSPEAPPCHPTTDQTSSDPAKLDSCPDVIDDSSTANFRCVSTYPGGGTGLRCLMPCSLNSQCRAGRVCLDFKTGYVPQSCNKDDCACTGPDCFCADAPPFDSAAKGCFDQLVNYQVSVGSGFLVEGSQAGIITTAPVLANGTCDPNPTPDARFSFRIPMNAPACTNVNEATIGTIDSRIDPDFVTDPTAMASAKTNAAALVAVASSTPAPADPCLYLSGPVGSDPATDLTVPSTTPTPQHVRALFKNSQISFVLANIDRAPTGQFVTSFDVHGGFSPQVVQDPPTVEVSMPARIVLGPVDSLSQVNTGMTTPSYEAPYLFVVDQRRLGREQGGGPTRGQLLRINPFGYTATVGSVTGYQPIFEDYNASGGLFPIQ